MEEEILKLDIPFLKILEADDDLMLVELRLLHEGINRNNCDIDHECVLKSLPTIFNKYIIYRYANPYFKNDFDEHNRSQTDTSMEIAGHIPESSDVKFIQDNDKNYLVMQGIISKRYQPSVFEIIKNRGGEIKVSIEIGLVDSYKQANGIIVVKEFKFLGVTLLGEGFVEGIEGSKMNVVKYSIQDVENDYLHFSLNYKIPDKVKENSEFGLRLRKEHSRGGTSSGVAMAKYLIENKDASYGKVKKISEYFSKHSADISNTSNSPSNEYISNLIWGGKGSQEWVKNILENYEKEANVIMNSIGSKELEEKLWSKLSDFIYHDGSYVGKRYWIQEIYPDEKAMVVKDNQTNKFYKMGYSIDKEGDIKVREHERKEVDYRFEERPNTIKNAILFAKEDMGKSDEIKVEKSADAMSEKNWGEVDKSKLRKEILDAKNYKSLVHEVYLVVEDGWEDSPSSKLKYPVMLLEDGKLVYSRYGIASALGYAKANNDPEVIDKAEALYKKLKIDEKEGGKVVDNKLDKDNKEIKKIRDDADAMEDDKKEEMKNSSEIDKRAEKKLKDDVESDEDEMAKKFAKMEEELNAYKAKEEEALMAKEKEEVCAMIDKFKKLFKAEEIECAKKMAKADAEDLIKCKALEFVAKKFEDECEDEDKGADSEARFKSFSFGITPFKISATSDVVTKEDIVNKYVKKNNNI